VGLGLDDSGMTGGGQRRVWHPAAASLGDNTSGGGVDQHQLIQDRATQVEKTADQQTTGPARTTATTSRADARRAPRRLKSGSDRVYYQ
jgi:hypothetical protein